MAGRRGGGRAPGRLKYLERDRPLHEQKETTRPKFMKIDVGKDIAVIAYRKRFYPDPWCVGDTDKWNPPQWVRKVFPHQLLITLDELPEWNTAR